MFPLTPPLLTRKKASEAAAQSMASPHSTDDGSLVMSNDPLSAPNNDHSPISTNNSNNSSSIEAAKKDLTPITIDDCGDHLHQPEESIFDQMTTGLLSLSVHDEMAFNGTEVALHPDLFANAMSFHFQQQRQHHSCMPGDLVEIRVWDAVMDLSLAEYATCKVLRPNIRNNRQQQQSFLRSDSFTKKASDSTSGLSGTSQEEQNNEESPRESCQITTGTHHKDSPTSADKVSTSFSDTNNREEASTHSSHYFYKTKESLLTSKILMEFPSSLSSSSLHSSNNSNSNVKTIVTGEDDGIGKLNNSFDNNSRVYELRTSFVMKVGKHFALKENSRSQISLLRQVAELYNLSAYDTVTVTKINKHHHDEVLKHVSTDFMMVTIKDQFISRGEMFHYQNSLLGKWIFCGERLTSQDGVRAIAKEIRHADRIINAGIVTKETKITFRSRSARIIWIVQISTEMWDYASPYDRHGARCQIYFDKFVQFMYRLFEKWKALEVTHSLTVLFFSRTYVTLQREMQSSQGRATSFANVSTVQADCEGRLYQDHYKVVVENETRADWESLVLKIKRAFLEYPHNVGWNISSESESRIPSTAAQGNLLEAINVTMNVLSLHYIDRDLHRTGNSIVVISAGNGVFEVEKKIAGITKQRMMDNGIGSDMLCLGLPPLHVAPFFLYKDVAIADTNAEDKNWFDDVKTFFEIPHWMNLSFVEYDPDEVIGSLQSTTIPQETKIIANAIGSNAFAYLPVASDNKVQTHLSRPNANRHSQNVSKASVGQMSQQRDLISCRDFEDILVACRPRCRAYDSSAGLPSALRALLQNFRRQNTSINPSLDNANENSKGENFTAAEDAGENALLTEWGAVNFDSLKEIPPKLNVFDFADSRDVKISDKSLHSHASQLQVQQIQKQKSSSLPVTFQTREDPSISAARLQLMMEDYDANIFSSTINRSQVSDNLINRRQDREMSFIETTSLQKTAIPINSQQKNGIGAALKGFTASGHAVAQQASTLRKVWSSRNFQAAGGYSPYSLTLPSGPSSLSRHYVGSYKQPTRRMPVAIEPPGELEDSIDHTVPTMESETSNSLVSGEFLSALVDRRLSQASNKERIGPLFGSPSSLLSFSGHGVKNRRVQPGISGNLRQNASIRRLTSLDSEKSHSNTFSQRQEGIRHDHRGRSRRKPWVLNPFRQQDEDEMLSKRTHNRRRWSHVFPPGEAEFKRHSGPLWNSLCQPAVLPLSTDYLPEEYELNDPEKFEFNHYNIFIDAMDRSYYSSYSELLSEMVIQRIIQDYQIVSQDILDERRQSSDMKKKKSLLREVIDVSPDALKRSSHAVRFSSLRSEILSQTNESAVQHILSMGHNVVYLRYNKNADVIEIVQYHAKFANDDSSNTYTYRYLLWMPLSAEFQPVSLVFNKFGSLYRWNRLDNLICGDPSKAGLSEDFKFRRIGFGIIPDRFDDSGKEHEYVQKFLRLLDYLKKLVSHKDAPEMDVKVVSSKNRQEGAMDSKYIKSADRLKRFIIQLRKGTRDKYEWLELVIDATFDTQQAFRIDINWLVASGSKVEAQIQLLLRRCSQYGLRIVQLPNYANSSTLYLHPFIAPSLIATETSYRGRIFEEQLQSKFQFVYDGKRWVDPTEIPGAPGFQFPMKRGKRTRLVGRQYIHRSGVAFIRAFEDENGFALFFWLQNRFLTGNSEDMQVTAASLLRDLKDYVDVTSIVKK